MPHDRVHWINGITSMRRHPRHVIAAAWERINAAGDGIVWVACGVALLLSVVAA